MVRIGVVVVHVVGCGWMCIGAGASCWLGCVWMCGSMCSNDLGYSSQAFVLFVVSLFLMQ